jgi:serine protease AprX
MSSTKYLISTAVIAALSGQVNAEAIIGPELGSMMSNLVSPTRVVVTTKSREDLDSVMQNLSTPYLALQVLPMAGATLSKAQIESLANDDRVVSIYWDAPVEYYNFTSGEITGGHYVHDVEGVTGKGSTIAVLDSGVDATHPDLQLGSKVIENVKIAGDLDLAGGYNLYLEGVPNSDTSSGHGTHVAGTVAGSGMASANDSRRAYYHDGIAPDATMVGLGAGEAISILYSAAGFDYAIANKDRLGIDILTNSWGGGDGSAFDPNNPINQASYEAYRNGIVVTFAASNSGPDDDTLNRYAIAPWVINVAAGNADKSLADFSSRGVAGSEWKNPDVTAPGRNIVSTRAVNTPLPVLKPVVDAENPDYYVYYAGMSGTSMATPFIAGVAGLLLEVNPNLSPDQIEEIIKVTADDMPGYEYHEVGDGYVNVKAAVELARTTEGNRDSFMAGQTLWASQGNWVDVAASDAKIDYMKSWKNDNNGGLKTKKRNASVMFNFVGDGVLINYTSNSKGGHAEVFLNGESKGMIDYFSTQQKNDAFAIRDLDPTAVHSVEIRRVQGTINFNGLKLDGKLVDNGTRVDTEYLTITDNIGPSAENIQFNDHVITLAENTAVLDAVLSWEGVADLDFELLDPQGNAVASSASLDNPEVISFRPQAGGDYVLRVNGYASVSTDYTIDVEVSSLVSD